MRGHLGSRHDLKEASLWAAFSRKPRAEQWLVDYLREDRDIRVLWLGNERLSPSC